jgi:cytidine deaminase
MSQNETRSGIASSQLEDLRQRALAVAQNAYAPYSHFRVGAALLLEDGNVVVGCNVENASYRLTTCAEQTAIATAVTAHGPDIRISAIVVVNLNNTASQPCGGCRQTIFEFSTSSTEVFFPASDGSLTRTIAADLLPHAFRLPTDNL